MKISEQTIYYSIQQDQSKPFQATAEEEEERLHLGICVPSSVVTFKHEKYFCNTQVGK
jgi:hypothetical protein